MITIILSVLMQQAVLDTATDMRLECEDKVGEALFSTDMTHWEQIDAMRSCQRPFTKY